MNTLSQTSSANRTTYGSDGRSPIFLELADEVIPVVVVDLAVHPGVPQPLEVEVRRQEEYPREEAEDLRDVVVIRLILEHALVTVELGVAFSVKTEQLLAIYHILSYSAKPQYESAWYMMKSLTQCKVHPSCITVSTDRTFGIWLCDYSPVIIMCSGRTCLSGAVLYRKSALSV